METFIKEVSVQEGWAFPSAAGRFLGASIKGSCVCAIEQFSLAAS